MATDEKLRVELGGADVTLTSVDPLELLELSTRYLELLRKAASEFQVPLGFNGIDVESGSARVVTRVSDVQAANFVQQRVSSFITGVERPPPSLREPTEGVKRVLRALPGEHSATVIFLNRTYALIPGDAPAWEPPASLTTFRARLIAIGGKAPRARFLSRGERGGEPFSLEVTAELARKLAPYLYMELEISVRIQRDEESKIKNGKLLKYTPVNEGDALGAWRQWFRENAPEWEDVVDIERELGRDGP